MRTPLEVFTIPDDTRIEDSRKGLLPPIGRFGAKERIGLVSHPTKT